MASDVSHLDGLFHDFLNLKKLRRTGWQLRGIRDGESLADHCFGVVFLTMVLADYVSDIGIDKNKALRMALVHELGECRVGDIAFPALEFLKGKSEAEQKAVQAVLAPLGPVADGYRILFEEFEKNETREAKFVRAIDKLDMLLTAAEYERTGFTALRDFWENAVTFECFGPFPALAAYAEHLKENRQKRMGG